MSRFIAIDADAGGLFVAVGTARGPAVKVDHAFTVADLPGPLSERTASAIASALKAALAAAGVGPAPVLLSVGRDRAVFKEIKHPPTAPAEEPRVVRFQAERDLAEPSANLFLDYVPLPTPDGSVERRATAVFVRKELYAAAERLCEDAGMKLAGFTPRPYATAAAVRRAIAAAVVPPPERPTAPIGVFSLWDGGGEFVVTRGEAVLFSRSLSAAALQSEAAMVGEAKRSLAGFAAQHPKDKLDAVYLCEGHGGGSWVARLQAALPLPVHPFDPLAGQPAAESVPPALRGRYAAAVGLLVARAAGPLPINFVSPRQPRAKTNAGAVWALVGLALLLLVGCGVAIGTWWMHKQYDDRITAANKRAADAELNRTTVQKEKNKQDAVEEFRKRGVNTLDLFYEVVQVMPSVSALRLREFDLSPPQKTDTKAPAAGGLGAAKTAAPTGDPVVASLRLQFVTASDADDDLPRQVHEEMVKESGTKEGGAKEGAKEVAPPKYFANPQIKFTAVGTKRDSDITAGIYPRAVGTFTRVLHAEFPKLPKLEVPPNLPPPVINPDNPP